MASQLNLLLESSASYLIEVMIDRMMLFSLGGSWFLERNEAAMAEERRMFSGVVMVETEEEEEESGGGALPPYAADKIVDVAFVPSKRKLNFG